MTTPTSPSSGVPPCALCHRPRRPNGALIEDCPGTVQAANARECVTCRNRRVATGLSFEEYQERELDGLGETSLSSWFGGLDSDSDYVAPPKPITADDREKVARLVDHDPELMWMLGLTERNDHAPVAA